MRKWQSICFCLSAALLIQPLAPAAQSLSLVAVVATQAQTQHSDAPGRRIQRYKGTGNYRSNPELRKIMKSPGARGRADTTYIEQRNLLLFSIAAAKLESELPNILVATRVLDIDSLRFDVSKTPPSWVGRFLSNQPFETQIYLREGSPSQRDLEDFQYAAMISLQSDFPMGSDIQSTHDSVRGVLSFTYDLSEPISDEELATALDNARARVAEFPGGASVPMEFLDAETTSLQLTLNIKGGHSVRDGGSACTTAFTVRNSSTQQQGVLSAAHCGTGSAPLYDGASGVLGLEQEGLPCSTCAYRDVQWYPSTNLNIHPTTKRFRYDNNDAETSVSDTGSPQAGAYVCQYGLVTNDMRCGYVVSSDTVCKIDTENTNRTFCGLKEAAGGNLASTNGDSGGPWFNGGVAMGVQSGKDSGGSQYFTPVPQITYALPNLKIRTNADSTS